MAKVHLYSPALRAQYGVDSITDVVDVSDEVLAGLLAAGAGALAGTAKPAKAEKAVSKKSAASKKAVREP